MRDKQELDQISLMWAYRTLDSWKGEYGSWDLIIEIEDLSDEELEYCMNKNFFVEIK